MAPLGPFEPGPRLAVAVSGGADSLALALLARDWARARGGAALALVVDHGIRPESAAEARATCARLVAMGIEPRILTLALARGAGLAARARTARHAALADAASALGLLHLLFGHHAGDQAETVAMRRLAGSGAAGLAGMAALSETAGPRRLRPLLAVPPGRLRATLEAAGIGWIEDPSNADPSALRARLRQARGDAAGAGVLTRAAVAAAQARGVARAAAERGVAAELAAQARLHPEGYAVVAPGPVSAAALAALLRMIGGAAYPPAPDRVAGLFAAPRGGTLGGVRVLPAGRLGPGHLVVREAAAMAGPVAAIPGAVWDGRFRLGAAASLPAGAELGALGAGAAALRRLPAARCLSAAVLRTLPAVRRDGRLFAVPHLGYPDFSVTRTVPVVFAPASPVACAPFVPLTGRAAAT